jgi:hypothetical protein
MCHKLHHNCKFSKSDAKLEKLCNLELWLAGLISALYWLGRRALTSTPAAAAAQPEPEVLGAGAGGGSDGERQLYFREEERKRKRLAPSLYLQPAQHNVPGQKGTERVKMFYNQVLHPHY